MSVRKTRRLSAAAVASAALAALTFAPQAHATVPGVPSSPLIVTHSDGTTSEVGKDFRDVVVPWAGRQVSYSPDGSKMAFVANGQIYTSNADGSGLRAVAKGAAPDAHPTWAYAGELLIFGGWDVNSGAAASGPTQLMATWSNGSAVDSQGTLHSWPLPKAAVAGFADSAPDYGVGTVAFVRTKSGTGGGADTPQGVWVRDEAGSYTPYQVAAVGTAPTVSPDGGTVAFVAPDTNGVQQLWTVPTTVPAGGTLATPVQQTFNTKASLAAVSNPVFSPDGKTLAFEQTHSPVSGVSSGDITVFTVAVTTDPKATANTETPYETTALDGTERLSYRTEFVKEVDRLAGADRLGTAQSVSQSVWRNNGDNADTNRTQADVAVLSRSDLPADALAGSALAAQKNGPLLLTSSSTLSPQAAAELKRILPRGARVYLLGGTQALSPAVAAAVQGLGFTVDRIAGEDRYQTAVRIAQTVNPKPTEVLVATGNEFADALSAGAAAGATGAVVVLSNDTTMPKATADYLKGFRTNFDLNSNVELTAVGGQALKAIDSLKLGYWRLPLVGTDRYQTSYLVAKTFFPAMDAVGVATGRQWPDALSGGAAMGSQGGPLLLVNPATGLSPQDVALLDQNRGELYAGYVFGGPAAVPAGLDKQLAADIAGPLGVKNAGGTKIAGSGNTLTARQVRDRAAALLGGTDNLRPVQP